MSSVEQRLKEFRQKKEEGKKREEQREHLWNLITFAGVRNRWRNANRERASNDHDDDDAAESKGDDDDREFLDDDEDASLCPQTPIDAAILLVKASSQLLSDQQFEIDSFSVKIPGQPNERHINGP